MPGDSRRSINEMKDTVPSNTWRFLISVGLTFLAMLVGWMLIRTGRDALGQAVCFAGMGIPFLGVAVAQLTTDYIWKNMSPGNRGSSRAQHPRLFWLSVCFNAGISIAIIGFALMSLRK